MNDKVKKKPKIRSPHKDPEKKSLFISSVARLLKGANKEEKLSKLLKNVKGIPSDADVARIKKALPKYSGGGMITKKGWGKARKT